MVLVIDIGNTHIVVGIYSGNQLVDHWRIETDTHRSEAEYADILLSFLNSRAIPQSSIQGAAVSSVVPALDAVMLTLCRSCFRREPLFITPGIDLGLQIRYTNPADLGADRLVNAVAAFHTHRRSLVVIDLGTATTFDYITAGGDFMGGAIAPGLATSAEALWTHTARLPRVPLAFPGTTVAASTVESMQSGIMYGYSSLIEGMVRRIKDETASDAFVVATGGLAAVIAHHSVLIDEVDIFLTLRGLKLLYDRNTHGKKGM